MLTTNFSCITFSWVLNWLLLPLIWLGIQSNAIVRQVISLLTLKEDGFRLLWDQSLFLLINMYIYTNTHTHTHNSALKRKEILTYGMTWMNLEDIMLTERSQSQKTNTVWFHLHEVLRGVKITEIGSRMLVVRSWGMGHWGVNGYTVSVLQDERVLEMDGGKVVQEYQCT